MPVEGDAYHEPVLLEEAVASLNCHSGGIYVDGTVGGGGHAALILERSAPDGFLIGMDVDDEALEAAAKRLEAFGRRKRLVKANFADIRTVLAGERSLKLTVFYWILGFLPISWTQRSGGSASFMRRLLTCAWTRNPVEAPMMFFIPVLKGN